MLVEITPKFIIEIVLKLTYIYLTRYMHDFYCEKSL